MHMLRKELCIRLTLILLCICGLGYYSADVLTKTIEKSGKLRARPVAVNTVALPSDATKEMIATGIALVQDPGHRMPIPYLTPSLVEKKQGRTEMAQLTMLIQGEKHQYTMINNRMYREGDTLLDGRKVVAINSSGVLLSALGKTELLPWVPPLKVELKKSVPAPPATSEIGTDQTSVATPVAGGKKTGVMDADQALQLIKQLEAVSASKK